MKCFYYNELGEICGYTIAETCLPTPYPIVETDFFTDPDLYYVVDGVLTPYTPEQLALKRAPHPFFHVWNNLTMEWQAP